MSDYYPGAYEGAIVSGATREYRERIAHLEAEVERWKLAHEDIYREYGEKCERVGQLREVLTKLLGDWYGHDFLTSASLEAARTALAGEGNENA